MRNSSAQGSKLTNLHAEAAQCKPLPLLMAPANGAAALLDNSLTEHSLDNDIKMHVAPVEVQFRPSVNNNGLPAAAANGHAGRHHKNRSRAHRASRLTVLREYAYDVPTSMDGSVQSAPHRRHHHHHHHQQHQQHQQDMAARSSRRAAYMAYRERHQSQLQQQDSSDASTSLPRRPRHIDSGGGGATTAAALAGGGASGTEGAVGAGGEALGEIETTAGTAVSGANADSDGVKQPNSEVELESQPKSYGLNLATQNGTLKDNGQSLINKDSSASIKTGLWKHETTV